MNVSICEDSTMPNGEQNVQGTRELSGDITKYNSSNGA